MTGDFSEFIYELSSRIRDIEDRKTKIQEEIEEYDKFVSMLKEPKNLANLGDGCYVQSKMLSTGIYLHLGFGFHVEVDLVSAEVYSNSRVEILKRKAEFAHTELIEVKADYEEALAMANMLKQVQREGR